MFQEGISADSIDLGYSLLPLKEDPQELKNVVNDPENKEVIKELCRRLWEFAYKNDDVCINPYIMVSHAPYGPGIVFNK